MSTMHVSGAWILLIFVCILITVMLLVLHLTRLGVLIHQRIPDRPHQRLLFASVSFLVTFIAVRLLVASITHHIGPFGYVEMGGRHIHHLVWGILLLLITGYAELAEVGMGSSSVSILLGRLLALAYGAGAALTLDEFALWLNLDPLAYWSPRGTREHRRSCNLRSATRGWYVGSAALSRFTSQTRVSSPLFEERLD